MKFRIWIISIVVITLSIGSLTYAEEQEYPDMENMGVGVDCYTVSNDFEDDYDWVEIIEHDFESYPHYDWVTLAVGCDNEILKVSGNIKALYQYSEYSNKWELIKTSSCENYEEIWNLEGEWVGRIYSEGVAKTILMRMTGTVDSSIYVYYEVYKGDTLCGEGSKTVYYNIKNQKFSFAYMNFRYNFGYFVEPEILEFEFDKNGIRNVKGYNTYPLTLYR